MSSAWRDDPQRPFRRYLSKVPELTAFFWVVKLLASTAGEPVTDFLGTTADLDPVVTTTLLTALLAVVLWVQIAVPRYVPWLYWLAVVLISLASTVVTDDLVGVLGFSRPLVTLAAGGLLIAALALWRATERTLSLHTIDTPSREAFCWLAVLLAFGLGTAGAGLGAFPYGVSAIAWTALTVAAGLAYRFLRLGAVAAFWISYVLTQPLGTSIGELLAQPADAGGLGFGTTTTSAATLAVIVVLVAYLSVTHHDQPSLDNATRHAGGSFATREGPAA